VSKIAEGVEKETVGGPDIAAKVTCKFMPYQEDISLGHLRVLFLKLKMVVVCLLFKNRSWMRGSWISDLYL
jgi:hypothetical protein